MNEKFNGDYFEVVIVDNDEALVRAKGATSEFIEQQVKGLLGAYSVDGFNFIEAMTNLNLGRAKDIAFRRWWIPAERLDSRRARPDFDLGQLPDTSLPTTDLP